MLRTLCLFTLLAGVLFAAAPPTPTADDALIRAARKDSTIVPNLMFLSDEIGPRLTGSAALNRACRWAADKMRDYGLEGVTMEAYTIPEGWERGEARARLVEPANGVRIHLASYGWRPGTDGKVTADLAVLTASSVKDLEKYKGKLRGTIVLAGAPSKMRPFDEINKSNSPYAPAVKGGVPRPSYAEMREYLKERDKFLTREGAVALLLDSGKPFGLPVTTGGWGGERPSAVNKLPTLSVAHDSYAMLHRLASRNGPKARLELEVSNTFVPGPIKVFNVFGDVKGSEKPDEFVVVGAHIDSWDLGQGTTDNGTGTCIVLEAGRVVAGSGVRPKRTVRFCLFSGEEQGLFGSRHYAEKHGSELARTSAALMHDVGTGRVLGLGVGGRPAVAGLLKAELASLRPLGVTDFETRSFPGSDHESFNAKGVPGFLMAQDPAYYTVSHHTAADTPERLVPADLVQGAQVLAVASVRVANLEKLLPREKQPEPKKEAKK